MGRLLKRVFKLGVLAGAGYAVWRFFDSRRSESGVGWEPQPVPFPPKPRAEPVSVPEPTITEPTITEPTITEPTNTEPTITEPTITDPPVSETAAATPAAEPAAPANNGAWVEPLAGTCPDGYPVKAKMASGIYHVKGGLSYGRTTPDRCYRDPESAEADGLRPAKR